MRQKLENLVRENGSELTINDPHLEVIVQQPRRPFIMVDLEGYGPVRLASVVMGFFGMVGAFFGLVIFGIGYPLLVALACLGGVCVGGYLAGLGSYWRHDEPLRRKIEEATGVKIPRQSQPGFKKSYDGTKELKFLLPYKVSSLPEFNGVTVFSDDKWIYLIKNTYYYYDQWDEGLAQLEELYFPVSSELTSPTD